MFSSRCVLLFFCVSVVIFSSCSFNYNEGLDIEKKFPEMVMTDVNASRYENSKISLIFTAKTLEIYDADRVWAGESANFTQYDAAGTGTVEAEASAGMFLIDDAAGVYSLGNNTMFRLVRDDMQFDAPDLKWNRTEHRLCGSRSGAVRISSKDGTDITGIGFVADTMSRTFSFTRAITGRMVMDSDKKGENDAAAGEKTATSTGQKTDGNSAENSGD